MEIIDWIKLAGFLLTTVGMIIAAVWGYAKLNHKVDDDGKSIIKNDRRLRKELNEGSNRYNKRFEDIEADIDKLMENRSHHDRRLTHIEDQTEHTAKTMDVLVLDVKEIMKQLTSVAATMDAKERKG